ncbi:efflux RND transporter periplasmic adaptor subunit [Vallitaleaceae bacterium 9-2]
MKKLITIFVVLAIISIIVIPRVMDNNQGGSEESVIKSVTVEAEAAKTQKVETYIDLIGSTYAKATVPVMAPVPADVDNIHIAVGDYVTQGQVLFSLDPSDVENQVKQAQLSVDQASAAAAQANVGINSARESIKTAELAYELAKSNYEMNLENYEFAVDNLEKNKELYEQGVISEVEYEQIRLQASPESLTILKKQLEQAEQALNQARLGENQASASYGQAAVGIDMAQEGYQIALDTLNDLEVTAPIDGYITTLNLTENAMATNQQAAIVIEDLMQIKVTASVTPETVSKINKGDQLQVMVGSYEEPFTGEVTGVSLSANSATRLYPIEVTIENDDGRIRPGMFATIKVINEKSEQALTVPSDAVLQHDDGYVVYRLVSENKAEPVTVQIGIDTGYEVEITQGLSKGDVVITKGAGLINEETELNVIRGDE